jgi:hypothetical protein
MIDTRLGFQEIQELYMHCPCGERLLTVAAEGSINFSLYCNTCKNYEVGFYIRFVPTRKSGRIISDEYLICTICNYTIIPIKYNSHQVTIFLYG